MLNAGDHPAPLKRTERLHVFADIPAKFFTGFRSVPHARATSSRSSSGEGGFARARQTAGEIDPPVSKALIVLKSGQRR